MGWETNLVCSINFHKETYDSLYKVENDIEETEEELKDAENELRSLVIITEPAKMFTIEDGNPIDELRMRCESCLITIEDCHNRLFKLRLLKSNWDKCHYFKDGYQYAIKPPSDINEAYLSGDFIKTGDEEESTQ